MRAPFCIGCPRCPPVPGCERMWVGTPLVGPKHRENFKEFGVCEFRYHGGRHSFFLCHPCNLFLWAQKLASQRQVPGPPRARFPGYSPHCASCLPIQPWAGPFRRTRRLSKGNQATASPQVSNEDPSLGDHRATPFIHKKYIYADNGTTVACTGNKPALTGLPASPFRRRGNMSSAERSGRGAPISEVNSGPALEWVG